MKIGFIGLGVMGEPMVRHLRVAGHDLAVWARRPESAAALDWPRNKLHIQLLDDSTDETAEMVRQVATELRAKGFDDEKIAAVNAALKSAFDIKFVFNKWTLGEDFC